MPDTEKNRRRLIRFVSQEVVNERKKTSGKPIPHFNRAAVALILKESQRRAGRRGKLTLRLRELGGLVRVAGDLAAEEEASIVRPEHIARARIIAKPLEQQIADRFIECDKNLGGACLDRPPTPPPLQEQPPLSPLPHRQHPPWASPVGSDTTELVEVEDGLRESSLGADQ